MRRDMALLRTDMGSSMRMQDEITRLRAHVQHLEATKRTDMKNVEDQTEKLCVSFRVDASPHSHARRVHVCMYVCMSVRLRRYEHAKWWLNLFADKTPLFGARRIAAGGRSTQ